MEKEIWGRPGSHRIAFLEGRFLRGPSRRYSLLLCLCVSAFTPRLGLISMIALELNHIRICKRRGSFCTQSTKEMTLLRGETEGRAVVCLWMMMEWVLGDVVDPDKNDADGADEDW